MSHHHWSQTRGSRWGNAWKLLEWTQTREWTVKDMHYLHGPWEKVWIWSTVDIRHGTALPWFAWITAQSVSISARKWGFHCLQMNTSLILIQEDWVVFPSVHLLCHVCHSLGWIGLKCIFPFLNLITLPFMTVTAPQTLTIMTHWRWLLLFWLFI